MSATATQKQERTGSRFHLMFPGSVFEVVTRACRSLPGWQLRGVLVRGWDWDSDDWLAYIRIIPLKGNEMSVQQLRTALGRFLTLNESRTVTIKMVDANAVPC